MNQDAIKKNLESLKYDVVNVWNWPGYTYAWGAFVHRDGYLWLVQGNDLDYNFIMGLGTVDELHEAIRK
jgi:hypothetical protein